MTQFADRKEQIEKDFLKKLVRDLKKAGCLVSRKGRVLIKEELKSAAMVGACEERSRTLAIIRSLPVYNSAEPIATEIVKRSVLEVLGYE